MIPLDVNGEYLESKSIARKSIRKLEKIIYLFESLRALNYEKYYIKVSKNRKKF